MPTIGRYYFRVCTEGARRVGVDVDSLLATAGLDRVHLADPGWRGPVHVMARLVQSVSAALGDEYMGFTPRGMPIGAFAFAAGLMVEAASVGAGLARAMRFYNLASPDIETTIEEHAGECVISVAFGSPALDPDHYLAEFWMAGWHRIACWLAGEAVPLHLAEFDYPSPTDYLNEFRHLFPCPHRHGAEARRIRLDARALHGPVRRTPAEMAAMVARAPLDIMTIPSTDHSIMRRVRTLLTRDTALDADGVATALKLSPDGLRRRLRHEGRTLSSIREDVRRDVAMRALLGSNRSVEAIAAELGYAEPRSFTRAFRLWTGNSPSTFRRQQS